MEVVLIVNRVNRAVRKAIETVKIIVAIKSKVLKMISRILLKPLKLIIMINLKI